jgi:NAD(P)-dependent dehydrogenase (short-subunit alcohol dehydrogenase family)
VSVAGKTILVTGATAGIGLATAAELARRGARVLVHGRSHAKATAAVETLKRETRSAELAPVSGDLASLAETRALAEHVLAAEPRLDVLINNAGVFMPERTLTADGLETTFQVNHLAYFLLTRLLLDRLRQCAPARVVIVSSNTHRGADLDFNNLQGERRYDGYSAYSRSKLCNVLFAYALARRVPASEVTVNALHPGVIATNLLRAGWGGGGGSLSAGAKTSVYLADSDDVASTTGQYFDNARPSPSSPRSMDKALQEKLWQLSESLAGLGASPRQ